MMAKRPMGGYESANIYIRLNNESYYIRVCVYMRW